MSLEREKILRYYRGSGDGDLAGRLLDLAEATIKSGKYRLGEFVDPYGYSIAETVVAHFPQLKLEANGGYLGAERVKPAVVHESFMGKVDFSIQGLFAQWDGRYHQLSHRDVLGALMGLGIKREVLGDIIMLKDGCQIVADATMASFLLENLSMIGSAPITSKYIDLVEIQAKEEKTKEIKATVSALRLDAVAAAGFGVSRSKMADEISSEKIKVNWQSPKNSAHSIKQNDVISLRGRGRVEVMEVLGETKKGRISILLKRFY